MDSRQERHHHGDPLTHLEGIELKLKDTKMWLLHPRMSGESRCKSSRRSAFGGLGVDVDSCSASNDRLIGRDKHGPRRNRVNPRKPSLWHGVAWDVKLLGYESSPQVAGVLGLQPVDSATWDGDRL